MDNIHKELNKLIGKTIKFNEKILKSELDYSPEQKTKVLDAYVWSGDHDVFLLACDFSEFAEENKQFAEHNYYDANSVPRLAFHETPQYPKDGKTTDYYDVRDLTNNNLPFDIID